MLIYLRLLSESFNFAINALKNNKLRTFLSLLGVTIGIFSIIAVLAAVDSLEKEIKGSLSSLDNRTLILARFSFGPTDIPRWKREQFTNITYDEFQLLNRNMPGIAGITYTMNVPRETLRAGEKTMTNVNIATTTEGYYDIEALQLEDGRFFNESESASGSPVIVIGHSIATNLFGDIDPVGQEIRMYGRKFSIIGVIKKEGSSLFGNSKDELVFVPVNLTRRIFGDNNRTGFTQITIKPDPGVDTQEFIAQVTQQLRNHRGLKPDDVDTFFINQLSGFTDLIDNITGQMNFIGLIISGFSLLVGGFGIANIMFVSVKERTHLIGIQKSLGAKNKFILFQFLFEAVILSIIGGLIGLVLVWFVSLAASQFTGDFEFILSPWNMFLGTAVSAVIGLISGIIPAISASKLDPVEAIRTGM